MAPCLSRPSGRQQPCIAQVQFNSKDQQAIARGPRLAAAMPMNDLRPEGCTLGWPVPIASLADHTDPTSTSSYMHYNR